MKRQQQQQGADDVFTTTMHRNIFTDTVVGDILKETAQWRRSIKRKDILLLKHDITIGEALQNISEHEVLSAPVIRYFNSDPDLVEFTSGEGHGNASYAVVGCVDVGSILEAMLRVITNAHPQLWQTIRSGMTYSETNDCALRLHSTASEFFKGPLSNIRGSNDACAIYRSDLWMDMRTLIDTTFLRPNHKDIIVHRSIVFDEQGHVVNILSQSDVLRYVYFNRESIRALGGQTLRQLAVPTPSVSTIASTVPALQAFLHMYNVGVSALAVIDEKTGALLGNLSASDLRGLSPAIYGCLCMPITEFWRRKFAESRFRHKMCPSSATLESSILATEDDGVESQAEHAQRLHERVDGTADDDSSAYIQYPVSCTMETTLEYVISALVENNIHRIYVVDALQNPVGVVTITNVLATLSAHSWKCDRKDNIIMGTISQVPDSEYGEVTSAAASAEPVPGVVDTRAADALAYDEGEFSAPAMSVSNTTPSSESHKLDLARDATGDDSSFYQYSQ
eukprot:gene22762-27482_t